MSPRPKGRSDAAILDASARVLARLGPARLRLEDVAREVGLSPSTLLLRFKSKRDLLLAVAAHSVTCMNAQFASRRARQTSPLETIASLGDCLTRQLVDGPQALSHALAFLQLSLEDPEFQRLAHRHTESLAREVEGLLREARKAREIIDCPIPALARAVIAVTRGSLLTWSTAGSKAPAHTWVREDLETLILPYRAPRPAATRTRAALRPHARLQ